MTIAFEGSHFERDVIPWSVRWYVAYPFISYRQIRDIIAQGGMQAPYGAWLGSQKSSLPCAVW